MSTKDHPDWWRPVGGQNSQDSTLERRSLIWNDNDVEAPDAPPAFYTEVKDKGKFYSRGMRGKIEQVLVYCVAAAGGTLGVRLSPHPGLGPIHTIAIMAGATWGWYGTLLEEMWDYDSLFIWVHDCDADVSWGYDAVQPLDGHVQAVPITSWADLAIRPFIRLVYTAETPGDVPVSGIVNNIPIPSISSTWLDQTLVIPINVETTFLDRDGIGHCDLIMMYVAAAVGSHSTRIRVYCDDMVALSLTLSSLSALGFGASTPSVSLTAYAINGLCALLLTHKFEFRANFHITAFNAVGGQTVWVADGPTFLR